MPDKWLIEAIMHELSNAREKFKPFISAHQGYAVLLEEVDELWELVKLKPDIRDATAMTKEAIQIAAMAIRFAEDISIPDVHEDVIP